MKERSKDRRAELLLEELFEQLAERENVKAMLGDLTSMPIDEVVEGLVSDFVLAIARRQVETLRAKVARHEKPTGLMDSPSPATPIETKAPAVSSRQKSVEGIEAKKVVINKPSSPPSKTIGEASDAPEPPTEVQLPSTSSPEAHPHGVELISNIPPGPKPEPFWDKLEEELKLGISNDHGRPAATTSPSEEDQEEFELEEEEGDEDRPAFSVASSQQLRSPCAFTDDDLVYVHGVMTIPDNDHPSAGPFMLQEKGINPKEFAFAFDYEGIRFYLSKVPPTLSVSKVGVLLLSKQESVELRGMHESILNDLRLHGILLPFEFGTLARGKDALQGRVDKYRDKILEALNTTAGTKWWLVSLFVLDARIAQLVNKDGSPSPRVRTVERASYTKVPAQKKYDIKLLERMLSKEKRLAESVHEELKKHAMRSDVDMMVSLGSGSSEDWKPILKASYEAPGSQALKLFRGVTDLQYHHMMFDLMLSISGDAEPFVLNLK